MHGRLKVKSTAEQEAAKQIEREKKIKKYLIATKRITEKRKNGEKDQEGIDITGQLLGSNPDYYTLWNIRREIFEDWMSKREDTMQEVYENELNFLEQCLRLNPKSYGSWHHRCWVIQKMKYPDWKQELLLCNKYLEYDERNFHCWDYRRFVVQQSNVSASDEFKYTTEKISTNFSNYSSWHYRSKLMPLVHPDPNHPVRVNESILLEEFELAQNAFFTDPNDQSAWFYHRWLLGRGERSLTIEMTVVDRDLHRCILVFNKEIEKQHFECVFSVDGESVELNFSSIGPYSCSKLWQASVDQNVLDMAQDHYISITLKEYSDPEIKLVLKKEENDVFWRRTYKPGARFSYELSAATADILSLELESCKQLHELEPDNKWTLLTIVLLMRALNPLNLEAESFDYLQKLEKIDYMRKKYYQDLRSKFTIENAIERLQDDSREIDLSGKKLTALYHMEHFSHLKRVDVSNNDLLQLNELYFLQSVEFFQCDDICLTGKWLKDLPKLKN